jgi:hypothetical protein
MGIASPLAIFPIYGNQIPPSTFVSAAIVEKTRERDGMSHALFAASV